MRKRFFFLLEKINHNNTFLESIKTMILRIIGVIILFGFTLFLTHNYNPKIIGQYDFIRTFLLVIGSICLLGTDQSILYFAGIIKKRGNILDLKNIYKKNIVLLFITSLIAFLIIFILGRDSVNSFFKDKNSYILLFKTITVLFFYCVTILNTETLRALNFISLSELFRNTFKYLSVIIGAVYLLYINKEIYLVESFIYGFVLLSIISTYIIIKIFNNKSYKLYQETLKISKKEIIIKSLPMAISSMSIFLIMTIDVVFIKKYCGNEAVAYYSTAVKLMTILSMIIISVNTNVSIKIAEFYEMKNFIELKRTVRNSSRIIFIFTIPIALLISFFSKQILCFFGNEYINASNALIILMIGQGISSAFGSAPVYLNMTGRQNVFQGLLLISVLIDFFLNILLTQKFGILGTSISFMLSSLFWIISATIFIYRKDKIMVFIH